MFWENDSPLNAPRQPPSSEPSFEDRNDGEAAEES